MNQNHSNSAICLIAGLIAGLASVASAQTTWTGNVDNNVTEAGNWNNGLPTAVGNPGTIGTGATVTLDAVPLTGYFVTQNTGSAVSGPASSERRLFDGSWTVNGGTFDINGALNLQNGTGVGNGNQDFFIAGGTVSATGTATVGNNASRTATLDLSSGSFTTRNLIVNSGSTLDISGGSFTANNDANASGIRLIGGSIVNISGGTISSNQEIRNNSTINFTGGSTTVLRLRNDPNGEYVMGGTTAGSLTVTSLNVSTNGLNMNWLTGSLMTVSIAVADWAETNWNLGEIFYNGQNVTTLGNWDTVSDNIFDWDGTTNTLSLAVVPEPSTFALLAGLLGFTWVMLRRR